MTMRRSLPWLVAVVWLMAAAMTLDNVSATPSTDDGEIRICHFDEPDGPWSSVWILPEEMVTTHRFDPTVTNNHGWDIIPPNSWDDRGRNWDDDHIAFWENECMEDPPPVTTTSTTTTLPETTTTTTPPVTTTTLPTTPPHEPVPGEPDFTG